MFVGRVLLLLLCLPTWLWALDGWQIRRESSAPVPWSGTAPDCTDDVNLLMWSTTTGGVDGDWKWCPGSQCDVANGIPCLDDNNLLRSPTTVVDSIKSFVTSPPGPGACPYQGHVFEHETLGTVWNCPFVGTNTNAVEEAATSDGVVSIAGNTGQILPSGPTTASILGAGRLSTAVSGSVLTINEATIASQTFLGNTTGGAALPSAQSVASMQTALNISHAYSFGCNDTAVVTAAVSFLRNDGADVCSTTDTQQVGTRKLAVRSGTLTRMHCRSTTAPGAGNSQVFTAIVGGANTGVTCTISGATATTCISSATAAVTDTLNSLSISYDPNIDLTLAMMCSLEVRTP